MLLGYSFWSFVTNFRLTDQVAWWSLLLLLRIDAEVAGGNEVDIGKLDAKSRHLTWMHKHYSCMICGLIFSFYGSKKQPALTKKMSVGFRLMWLLVIVLWSVYLRSFKIIGSWNPISFLINLKKLNCFWTITKTSILWGWELIFKVEAERKGFHSDVLCFQTVFKFHFLHK